jgi:hypothetical protein
MHRRFFTGRTHGTILATLPRPGWNMTHHLPQRAKHQWAESFQPKLAALA